MIIPILFLLFLGLFLPYSSAQTCQSDTFSQNRLYSTCRSLPELNATLHWTYDSNGTADIAYRVPQSSSGWAAWALNPNSSGMLGANVIFAFHDSSGVLTVITTVLSSTSYSPTIKNETLSFQVYNHNAEFSNGTYTIYATVALPSNSSKQNIVWQAGTGFQNGLPYGHPTSGGNVLSASSLDFATG